MEPPHKKRRVLRKWEQTKIIINEIQMKLIKYIHSLPNNENYELHMCTTFGYDGVTKTTLQIKNMATKWDPIMIFDCNTPSYHNLHVSLERLGEIKYVASIGYKIYKINLDNYIASQRWKLLPGPPTWTGEEGGSLGLPTEVAKLICDFI